MNKYIIITSFIFIVLVVFIIFRFSYRKIIKIGILLTTSGGEMAEYEKNLYDILCENINLYNSSQMKIYLEKYEFNPESNTNKYIEGAKYLCDKNVVVIFGCWRSIDRKAIIPIIEKNNNLLLYPLQYEGEECSKNILYLGACPNQQINIGIEYGIKNISNKIILIGSDYVFPRTANKIMKQYIKHMNATLVDEIYVSLTEKNFDNIVDKILNHYKNKPILIINTINGDSNKYFFETFYNKFKKNPNNKTIIMSELFPIMSFSLTESSINKYNIEWIYGTYFVWNYSQTDISYKPFLEEMYVNNSSICNILIKNFEKSEKIIDDPSYHIFLSLLFFIDFLSKYNDNYDSKNIRDNFMKVYDIPLLTPTGYLKINENNHIEQPVFILKTNYLKRYDTIYYTPINIKPNPWYKKYEKINHECNNKNFLGNYFTTLH